MYRGFGGFMFWLLVRDFDIAFEFFSSWWDHSWKFEVSQSRKILLRTCPASLSYRNEIHDKRLAIRMKRHGEEGKVASIPPRTLLRHEVRPAYWHRVERGSTWTILQVRRSHEIGIKSKSAVYNVQVNWITWVPKLSQLHCIIAGFLHLDFYTSRTQLLNMKIQTNFLRISKLSAMCKISE